MYGKKCFLIVFKIMGASAILLILFSSCFARKDRHVVNGKEKNDDVTIRTEMVDEESGDFSGTLQEKTGYDPRRLKLFEVQFFKYGSFDRPYTNYFLQLNQDDDEFAGFIAISENELYGSNIDQENIPMPVGNKIQLNTWWGGGGEKYLVARTDAGIGVEKIPENEFTEELIDDISTGELEIKHPPAERLFVVPCDPGENILIDFNDLGR
jgi:hypothetical protein